ncbi:MAG: ATP synthase F1 subunit gamma [Candidatus Saccharibacteria bacterium]|nr:ATP synthase F1 subunit gamma [Candidatus Saccharibacteria bacterium]
MASVAQLKNHIRSVNNTKQITGAMQLVAASKMRRASEQSLATQPYHKYISDLLTLLMGRGLNENHPLVAMRKVKTRLLIVITSDTGLAGAYNSNVLKRYIEELKFDRDRGVKTQTIAVGRKAIQLATRLGENVIGTYEGMSNGTAATERNAIVSTLITEYRELRVDAVDIIYTKFRSSVNQEVKVWNLLPAGHVPGVDYEAKENHTFSFEPSQEKVFGALIKRAIEIQVAQTLFDSTASEHSTRMLAMKNATDNATELSEDLTLAMNKERQAAITNELSDISNGANAIE